MPVNAVRLLTNAPEPVPSDVLLPVMSGLCEELQHTPLAVIDAPPSLVIFPPLTALYCVIPDITVVVSDGREAAEVVKVCSFP